VEVKRRRNLHDVSWLGSTEGQSEMLLKDTMERVNATTAVATLSGRMTHGMRLREVESQINQAVDDGVRVLVVDIGGIEYSDSAGLGLLMLLYGKMKTVKGSLRIAAPNHTLRELFTLTNTDKFLSIYPDRAAALVE
jgi:anti-sigma B factor antagonist